MKNIFSFSNKKLLFAFALFIFVLSLFFYFPKIYNANSDYKNVEKNIDHQRSDLAEIQKTSHDRLLKLHLLQRVKEKSNQNKEPRNLFLAKQNAQSNPRESSPQGEEKSELFLPPPFPYKIIGKVRFHKSDGFEDVAIVFNGFRNVFVKEGEMIDSTFKLIKINEDDVDIQYAGRTEIIKIEISGS